MSADRDTHFAHFARLLVDEMERNMLIPVLRPETVPIIKEAMTKIIARRGYDLVEHSVRYTGVQQYDPATGYASASIAEVIARDIPDLTEWPVERDE